MKSDQGSPHLIIKVLGSQHAERACLNPAWDALDIHDVYDIRSKYLCVFGVSSDHDDVNVGQPSSVRRNVALEDAIRNHTFVMTRRVKNKNYIYIGSGAARP